MVERVEQGFRPEPRHYHEFRAMLWSVALVLSAMAASTETVATTIYVSASASIPGNGSHSAPYNSLAAVEQASKPGDTIRVMVSPQTVAPLDGGIALKPGQKLIGEGPPVAEATRPMTAAPRITNTTNTHFGDAITMADNSSVSNLVIINARRSGVLFDDVTGVSVDGNDISASNTSCTPGLGYAPEMPAGTGMHGYGAVMSTYTTKQAAFSVVGNRIHDGLCMDGIHVRAGGTSVVKGRIDQNWITRLQQGPNVIAELGIGLETKDAGKLTVTSNGNSETFIGNPFGSAPTSDCEGLLSHQIGGDLVWTITNNRFAHGSGGSSCNGAEFFISEGHANSTISVADSSFIDAQGDMFQNINMGSGVASLVMKRVMIAQTELVPPWKPGTPYSHGSNTKGDAAGRPSGHCVMLITHGPGGVNTAKIIDSAFSNCEGDGVLVFYGPLLSAPGSSREISLDIDHSTITTANGYGLQWANYGSIDKTSIKMRNSFITGARDKAAVALIQDSDGQKPGSATFDFGTPDSAGGNCIGSPGGKAVEVAGVDAHFVGNFWSVNTGVADAPTNGTPLIASVSVNGGIVDSADALATPPMSCGSLP